MKKVQITHFIQEMNRIKGICFSNQVQIDLAVNTKRYLNEHFTQSINLDEMAQLQLTSKYHLIRVFKKYYGTTPRQYVIDKRLEKARQCLAAGQSVADTCYTVGFESIGSFSNLFSAKMGLSPSAYKRATFDKSKS